VKSRNRLIVLFSLAILSFSCERQYDQSDPINTLKAYIELNNQGNYDEAYKLFSDSSKLRITEHEFSLYQKTSKRLSVDSIYMTFMNPLRPNFRNYEISNKMENTVSDEHGVSNIVVSKEEEIWKVLWLETLIDSESSRLVKTRENFSTRNLFALGVINPICRRCNELIAWDYIGNDDLKNAKYYFQKAEEISPNTVDPLLATLYYSLNGDSLIALNWSKRIWSGEGSKRFLTEIRFLEIIDKLLDKGCVTLTKDLIEVATLWYPESLDIIEKKAETYHIS
jgi:tetratricopeptide (TPR) repeat protein